MDGGAGRPGQYGQLDLYETPQGTLGPANADAEISANSTVSKDISLLDTKGSEVLLGETLMVPIADSMIYLRPLYVAATTNPQPQLEYVVAVLGKNVQIDTSLQAVLGDVLPVHRAAAHGGRRSSAGTVPAAVANILQAAQNDYTNALAALKAGNLSQFQTDIQAMDQQIKQAQQVLTPGHDHHDHNDDDGATGPGGEVLEDGQHDLDDDLDHYHGADEHRAQGERLDDHLDDVGLGGGPGLRLRPSRPAVDEKAGCGRRRWVP